MGEELPIVIFAKMIGKSTAELDFRDNILYSQWDGKSEWSNEEYLKLRKQFRKKRKRCV